jgi:hypothetical protein
VIFNDSLLELYSGGNDKEILIWNIKENDYDFEEIDTWN